MSAVRTHVLTEAQLAQFRSDGYTMVPGVISPDEVSRLRVFLQDRFDGQKGVNDGGVGRILDTFFNFEDMAPCWSALNDTAVECLRSLLGDGFVIFPACSVHDSGFGIWHKDSTSFEQRGWQFHREPDYLMVQVAIYLQDNGREYGGGLSVVPGSHRQQRDRAVTVGDPRSLRNRIARRLANEIRDRRSVDLPSKAGDLLMFDFRLDHRATKPTCSPASIPSAQRKFALFFPGSANNKHALAYKEYLGNADFWSEAKDWDYPEGIHKYARSRGITLV